MAGSLAEPAPPRSILLIRRDNIGDLVLTTPLIHALRVRFPTAWIGVLGNSYNTPILAGHPDVDAVYAYDKAKHQPGRSRIAVYAATLRTILALRALRIDIAILAGAGPQIQSARLAALIRPHAMIGFVEQGAPGGVTHPVIGAGGAALHAAEDIYRLGAPLGITDTPGPCVLAADAAEARRFDTARTAAGFDGRRLVAVHVSARRPKQRWPVESFARVMRALAAEAGVVPVLLWAPGSEDDPRHPGDDQKAAAVRHALGAAFPCLPWPTPDLASLTGALAACNLVVCADGGAMHVAAGLGIPIVALFGDSPVARWRPWGVRHEVLVPAGGDVAGIATDDVSAACLRILGVARPAD